MLSNRLCVKEPFINVRYEALVKIYYCTNLTNLAFRGLIYQRLIVSNCFLALKCHFQNCISKSRTSVALRVFWFLRVNELMLTKYRSQICLSYKHKRVGAFVMIPVSLQSSIQSRGYTSLNLVSTKCTCAQTPPLQTSDKLHIEKTFWQWI